MSGEEARQRYRFRVSYVGTSFDGWQSQVSGNAIQDHLERALAQIHPSCGRVQGSGRTDAGVHAYQQVAHFEVDGGIRMDGEAWRRAMNTHLPGEIRVSEVKKAEPDFHARFSAEGKVYRYVWRTGEVHSPFWVERAWHVRIPLDEALVRQAGACFVGRHDFTAFSANRGDESDQSSKVRTIQRVEIDRQDNRWSFDIEGEGFLYKMVRMIAGSIVRCGQGKLSLAQLQAWLRGEDLERKAPLVAPAGGLYLVEVIYPQSPWSQESDTSWMA
ncbi:MAG: tRNA pseudouridine(38-40) synthase TruA [Verrucomicrobiota bacterium]